MNIMVQAILIIEVRLLDLTLFIKDYFSSFRAAHRLTVGSTALTKTKGIFAARLFKASRSSQSCEAVCLGTIIVSGDIFFLVSLIFRYDFLIREEITFVMFFFGCDYADRTDDKKNQDWKK